MKFGSSLTLLLTGTASAISSPAICKAPSASCKYVSQGRAWQCRDLVAAKRIQIPTCQVFKDATTTRTVQPTTTVTINTNPPAVTVKVENTITNAGKPVTLPTATITTTTTVDRTTTVVSTTTSISTSTTTSTTLTTALTTDVSTETTVATTTIPFMWPNCVAEGRKRNNDVRRDSNILPAECSCFLTATTTKCKSTKTITITKPLRTQTVYKTVGTAPKITRTVTVTKNAGTIIYAPKTTVTATQTKTQTTNSLTTVISQKIETSTKTDTTTISTSITTTAVGPDATVTEDPCTDIGISLSHRTGKLGGPSLLTSTSFNLDLKTCCKRCLSEANCVYYTHGASDGTCVRYRPKDSSQTLWCASDSSMCPMGLLNVDTSGLTSDPKDYYIGPCLGMIIANDQSS